MRGYIEVAQVITGAALNNAGQTAFSREFPMGEGWYAAYLRFNETVVIGTGAGPVAEGELLYVQNVLLKTDRGEIICNLPGRALYKIATVLFGTAPQKDNIAAASATYRVTLPIVFADMLMLRPEDTILDTSRYNSISVQITLGSVSNLFTAPGTATVATTVDVDIERSNGVLPGDPAKPGDGGRPIAHVNYDSRPPVDANSSQFIDVERSAEMSLKRAYVHSGTAGTAGVAWSGVNSDVVQNVTQLKHQNGYIEKDRIHAMVLDKNKMDYSLETRLAGVEVYDFVKDRSIASALATADKSVLQYTWTNQAGIPALSIVTLTQEAVRTLKK
jgi:hypothetical protein